jgi:hypothetical protein
MKFFRQYRKALLRMSDGAGRTESSLTAAGGRETRRRPTSACSGESESKGEGEGQSESESALRRGQQCGAAFIQQC